MQNRDLAKAEKALDKFCPWIELRHEKVQRGFEIVRLSEVGSLAEARMAFYRVKDRRVFVTGVNTLAGVVQEKYNVNVLPVIRAFFLFGVITEKEFTAFGKWFWLGEKLLTVDYDTNKLRILMAKYPDVVTAEIGSKRVNLPRSSK